MMQSTMQMPQQSTQLQHNVPQQQHLVTGQMPNQASPLLAQQLAGRPPVPGQHTPGMIQGQPGAGPMMQQRPPLLQTQQMQVRSQLQPGQQSIVQGSTGAVVTSSTTSTVAAAGDGPSVSSDDLEGLDSNVDNLGDLGMGDGDFLDMGDDFNILEFTDALDDLEDMTADDTKASSTSTTSTTSSSSTSTASSTTSTSLVAQNPSLISSANSAPTVSSAPEGATTSSTSISGTTISGNLNVVTSSAANPGMAPAGHTVSQPPPYTASGSVTVPLRGALPQVSLSGVMPGAPTSIIRGPPPPYPGPGLAPNPAAIGPGGPSNVQTSKVNMNAEKKTHI
jgi:hypothetical protein